MVADKCEVGSVQRQREFQNVKTLAEATDTIAKGLIEVAKVMAGFTSPQPHTMVFQNINIEKPRRNKGEAVTIEAERPASAIFEQ
jgi:hypothetical protein